MKILSAIQPSFFPWPGYFDIIKQSNVFLYYDIAEQKYGTGTNEQIDNLGN